MENKVVLTRDLLHSLVWAMPTIQLAEKFGISDVALGKICSKYDIPKPTRGQWARIQAGEKIDVKPLPKWREPSASVRVEIIPTPHKDPIPLPSKIEVKAESIAARAYSVHPLVVKTHAVLAKVKPEEHSRDVRPEEPDCLSMIVQVEHVERVLKIWNMLLIECERRGWVIQSQENPYAGPISPRSLTVVIVDNEQIGLSVRQLGYRMRPSKDDCLRIFGSSESIEVLPLRFTVFPRTPGESDAIRLQEKTGRYFEDHIDWLVATIDVTAKRLAEERKQREFEDQLRSEERDKEERKTKEKAHFRGFRASIATWRDYRDGMKMLDELELLVAEGGHAAPDELIEWISWARTRLEAEHPFGDILNCKFLKRDETPYHLRYSWNNTYCDWDGYD